MKLYIAILPLLLIGTAPIGCMEPEEPSKAELTKAYTPIPSQNMRDIDDVPAMCTEMTIRCYRQPVKVKKAEGKLETMDLVLSNNTDARIVGLVCRAAQTSYKGMLHINDIGSATTPLRTYSRYTLRLYQQKNELCRNIEVIGKAYEKIISKLKYGWKSTPREALSSIDLNINARFANDWFLFSKDEESVPDEDVLIRFLTAKFDIEKQAYCDSLRRSKDYIPLYLMIKKDAFEKVQEKLRFHLPSKEELIQQELSHELPFLEDSYENN